MMKRFSLSCFLLALCVSVSAMSTLDSLLHVLDDEVSHSYTYIARRQARIDSLRGLRPMTNELELRIASEYQHFQSDSSRVWYLKLIEAEEPFRTQAYINLVDLLRASGHFVDAITLFNSSEWNGISQADVYKIAWLLHREAAEGTPIPMFRDQLLNTAQIYYDSMMVALEQEAPLSRESGLWHTHYLAMEQRDYKTAIDASEQLLALTSPDEHRYAILAYGHAMTYEASGDKTKRSEWLVRSAITDVRCGITDNGSSWLVAKDCFDAGDLKRAYLLSDYSTSNATIFNAPARFIQNFTPGHLIASKHEYEQHKAGVRLIIVLILLTLALLGVVIGTLYSLRQNRKLKALNNQLQTLYQRLKETDKVKEQYICRYLQVYSDYIRRLTTMARKAGEKDPAAFMDREMDNFYRSFDDTFLSLYGTFVADFNALLKPEARLTPKPGERMTIEMRIFALILLGITSSAKIAELLCYSPNTISNYRVKMKNAALGDRDTFEQRVQEIGK